MPEASRSRHRISTRFSCTRADPNAARTDLDLTVRTRVQSAPRQHGASEGPSRTDAAATLKRGSRLGAGLERRRTPRRVARTRRRRSASAGGPAGPASKLVVPKPVGPGRPPAAAARRRGHLGDHAPTTSRSRTAGRPSTARCASTTTPTTSTRCWSSASRRSSEPRSRSPRTTRPTRRSPSSRPGAVAFDVIIGLCRLEHRQPDRAEAPAAAEPLLPAEPRQEHLAPAAGPLLRPRQPLHGALRRLDATASAGGTTRSRRTSARWTSPGTSSGTRRPTAARSACSTTSATRSACRSSATRCAPASGPT